MFFIYFYFFIEFEIAYSYIEHLFTCLSASPTSDGRSVGKVRSQTTATELLFVINFWLTASVV
jgi:hypothetical protein